MHYEELGEACKTAIGNYTEEEFGDIRMDHILFKACTPMIKKFCEVSVHSAVVEW
jgi:hypothetical protein